MKKIFAVLFLSSTLFACQKSTVITENEAVETKPGLHFSGLSHDSAYTVDFSTDIHGKLDMKHHDQNGRKLYTISASQKDFPSYFFAIRLLADSTGTITTGEYYLTPDVINAGDFDFSTVKGVGRFEYKRESGTLQSWTGTEWTERSDWAKITITKNENGSLSGEFSGRYTRTEVVYGDMKMNFTGSFHDIKTEYYE